MYIVSEKNHIVTYEYLNLFVFLFFFFLIKSPQEPLSLGTGDAFEYVGASGGRDVGTAIQLFLQELLSARGGAVTGEWCPK